MTTNRSTIPAVIAAILLLALPFAPVGAAGGQAPAVASAPGVRSAVQDDDTVVLDGQVSATMTRVTSSDCLAAAMLHAISG